MATADPGIDQGIETPCTRVCVVHPTQNLCVGCGRSLDEVARWIDLNAAERARIMAQLPSRLAALSGSAAGPSPASATACRT
jgi:predicted Fe-S protein YdhL (DUF1289 family)